MNIHMPWLLAKARCYGWLLLVGGCNGCLYEAATVSINNGATFERARIFFAEIVQPGRLTSNSDGLLLASGLAVLIAVGVR
jgi:hypothetical protein